MPTQTVMSQKLMVHLCLLNKLYELLVSLETELSSPAQLKMENLPWAMRLTGIKFIQLALRVYSLHHQATRPEMLQGSTTKLTHDEHCGFCPLPYIKTTLVKEYGQEKPL